MSSLTKGFEIMVTANLTKNLGPSMLKHNDDSCLPGRPRAVSNVHFFVHCQIDVVNKQLFSPIS